MEYVSIYGQWVHKYIPHYGLLRLRYQLCVSVTGPVELTYKKHHLPLGQSSHLGSVLLHWQLISLLTKMLLYSFDHFRVIVRDGRMRRVTDIGRRYEKVMDS